MKRLTFNPYANEGILSVNCDKCYKEINVKEGFYSCEDPNCGEDFHTLCVPA